MRTRNKGIALLLAGVLTFSLAGCGAGGNDSAPAEPAADTAAEPEEAGNGPEESRRSQKGSPGPEAAQKQNREEFPEVKRGKRKESERGRKKRYGSKRHGEKETQGHKRHI